MTFCSCGSELPPQACCEPIIAGTVKAPTALALMRARYTAFVTSRIGDFLVDTLAPERRHEFHPDEVEAATRGLVPKGMEIKAVTGGGEQDQDGTVEYVARFLIRRNQPHMLHERATFRRGEDGGWLYVDALVNPPQEPVRTAAKAGRNDPCPCGSGKKYKKCCAA